MTTDLHNHLYAGVLGASWGEVAAPVRSLHKPGAELCGVFRISRGAGRLARILARWSRLPAAATDAGTRLRIVEDGPCQRWDRSFAGVPMVSTQWAGSAGHLMERIGQWEFCFRLRVMDGALIYEQQHARFCLGPLRIPLPCGPHVAAVESPDGPARVRISVEVHLPMAGKLIAYDGWLDVEVPAL